MADPRIPGSKWIVAWVQSIDPENSTRGWSCRVFCERGYEIPGKPHPGFEWEADSAFRYRVIAVLDERSSQLLSLLEELAGWMDNNNDLVVDEAMETIIVAVIKGLEKVGRPY